MMVMNRGLAVMVMVTMKQRLWVKPTVEYGGGAWR